MQAIRLPEDYAAITVADGCGESHEPVAGLVRCAKCAAQAHRFHGLEVVEVDEAADAEADPKPKASRSKRADAEA